MTDHFPIPTCGICEIKSSSENNISSPRLFVWASTTKTSAGRRRSTCASRSNSSSRCSRLSLGSPLPTCASGTTTRSWASWSGPRRWSGERRRFTRTTSPTATTLSWTRSLSSSWESWRGLLAAREWCLALPAREPPPAASARRQMETERGFDESRPSLQLMHHHHLSGCSRAIGNHRQAGPAQPRTDVAAEKLPRWKLRAALLEISLDPSRIQRPSITGSSSIAKCFLTQRRIDCVIPTWYYINTGSILDPSDSDTHQYCFPIFVIHSEI